MSGEERLTWGAAELSHQPCSLFLPLSSLFAFSSPLPHRIILIWIPILHAAAQTRVHDVRQSAELRYHCRVHSHCAAALLNETENAIARGRMQTARNCNFTKVQGLRTRASYSMMDSKGEGRTGRKKETFDCLTGCRGLAAQWLDDSLGGSSNQRARHLPIVYWLHHTTLCKHKHRSLTFL